MVSCVAIVLSSYTLNRLLQLLSAAAILQARRSEAFMHDVTVPSFADLMRAVTLPTATALESEVTAVEVAGSILTLILIGAIVYAAVRGRRLGGLRPLHTSVYLKIKDWRNEYDFEVGTLAHPVAAVEFIQTPKLGAVDFPCHQPHAIRMLWMSSACYLVDGFRIRECLQRNLTVNPLAAYRIKKMIQADNFRSCLYALDTTGNSRLIAACVYQPHAGNP